MVAAFERPSRGAGNANERDGTQLAGAPPYTHAKTASAVGGQNVGRPE